jgi:hypothetical protein
MDWYIVRYLLDVSPNDVDSSFVDCAAVDCEIYVENYINNSYMNRSLWYGTTHYETVALVYPSSSAFASSGSSAMRRY